MTSPMMRDFSIPLRKIASTTTPNRLVAADKTEAMSTNVLPQQQATPTATASLRFTPRQISAPTKIKKQQKIASVVSSALLSQENEKTGGDNKQLTSGASEVARHQANIQAAVSIAGQSTSGKTETKEDDPTILDYTESKATPAFKAIQSEEPSPQGGGFIGPQLPSSPLPHSSPLRVTPFSLKSATAVSPKAVAMVPPQPQARGKPVARVRPNPHVQEADEETTPRKTTSKEGSLPSTPGPHLNAVTPWKVREATSEEAFGPALPEGMEYNSSAHGWSVSTIPAGGEEGQQLQNKEQQVPQHGKAKKHKKKKKHRKREPEEESNESEGERGGKRERNKKESSSSKKMRSRDVSYSPERGRRHHSHSPDKGHHHHDSTPHYDKYRKHRKHSYRDRERECVEHTTYRRHKHKGNRHSHHDRSRSGSCSRSRSPLNPDSEDRYHHHRERYRTSPSRHAHQHNYHTPFADREGERGHWKNKSIHHHSPQHRVKHSFDNSDKRGNIKSDEARRRERKRSHHHDTMSDEEHDHKKHKKTAPSGKPPNFLTLQ